ncbi:MAG: efflux RND transporter periplasmic adaptor subunit [Alphaproteobacteria bacterium]|nr:efflux RND transporter periplasmic adaptor subunit [Alphaproteobacteria bacterium]MDE2113226.1 efflux RND transporter periplasmic adaptor subunit [Alphaproteobacteria bacterium]MDE2492407.1 efflux RND transporter periplasmic adaptor subunit [Alphaproteobacteria bacterium]
MLTIIGAYWYFTGDKISTGGEGRAAPVRAAQVERRDMPVVEHTLGTIIATSTVQVTARVQGTLEKAYFHEGQFVKKGDPLFQIDPRPFQAALAQARGVLRRDEALLKNANRDKQRYEKLFATNAISSQQRDTADANADALAATVAVDKAALDMAQLNLGYTQIRSPIDGKTGPILVQPGNMVAAGGNTALVTIAQLRPIKLSFNLPQADLPRVQQRMRSRSLLVTIDRQGLPPLSAPVDFMSNAISSQAGTIELRATFGNADLALLPEQTVNATVQLDSIRHALVVPHDALNDGPNGTYVYVVANGRAQPRSVEILFDDSKHAAVEGDIRQGDEVVVEGQLRVVPGGDVKVFPPAASTRPKDRNRAEGAIGGSQ